MFAQSTSLNPSAGRYLEKFILKKGRRANNTQRNRSVYHVADFIRNPFNILYFYSF